MSGASIHAQIQQDADFFSSMVHMIPASYYAPQQDTDSKFTHSKGDKAASRQAMKESSSKALKAKAKFDPKNYTSVLSNGKAAKDESSDEDEDMEDDEDEEDEDEEMDEAPKGKPSGAAAKKGASAAVNGTKSAAAAVVAGSVAPASAASLGSSSLSSLPTPSLSSLSADIGMDQLRQRLHERIHGLSNKRKPEDHPFAKKRHKPDPKDKKKREKNEDRPSSHKGTAKPIRQRDDAAEQPAAKKQKSATSSTSSSSTSAATPSSSNSSSTPSSRLTVRESDIADSNDFQFAELKALAHPTAKTGSFSLQGKQQRKKNKADETLLREVESFESKVADLKAAGATEQARQLESERAMSNALLRAQGVKVKDDKKMLKKSLKRDEKKKDKSRQEWAERTSAAKSTQDAFHKDKIARASKKGKGDRSKYVAPGSEAEGAGDKTEKKGRGGDKGAPPSNKKGGRAGFEGKSNKKFLN